MKYKYAYVEKSIGGWWYVVRDNSESKNFIQCNEPLLTFDELLGDDYDYLCHDGHWRFLAGINWDNYNDCNYPSCRYETRKEARLAANVYNVTRKSLYESLSNQAKF
jgi:hypothetical protein